MLQERFPIDLKLILYPPSQVAELPYTTFYRYVLGAKAGAKQEVPRALFEKLPQNGPDAAARARKQL